MNQTNYQTDTLSGRLNQLKEEGYVEDFNLREACIVCRGGTLQLTDEEFTVDKFYRFEGETDPSDEAILYAISSDKHALKGVLVNGYGISSDSMTDRLMAKLHVHPESSTSPGQHA
jgi:hypothetical protein